MTKTINIIPADPAGNKTIFVTTPVERKSYQAIASFLLSLDEYEAEQVAFILPDESMEMCGLEFCGNASRTYGLIRAKSMGAGGSGSVCINVSGCTHPLNVEFDTNTSWTKIDMPRPLSILEYNGDILVDLGGIMHLVTTSKKAEPNTFQRLKNRLMKEFDPPALGVMFYDPDTTELIPVVYVADVDSTYFEGSCASGSVAVACAMTRNMADGESSFVLKQPKRTLSAAIKKRQNEIISVSIEGPVIIGSTAELQLPAELQI
jgi:diaminopimelate epimerase